MMNFSLAVGLFIAGLTLGYSGGVAEAVKVDSSKTGSHRKNRIVIDVRTPAEYATGHIAGTTNVPIDELSRRISEVVPDKTTPVAVHCRSGNRSARAKKELEKLGYKHVQDLGSLAGAREILESKSPAR